METDKTLPDAERKAESKGGATWEGARRNHKDTSCVEWNEPAARERAHDTENVDLDAKTRENIRKTLEKTGGADDGLRDGSETPEIPETEVNRSRSGEKRRAGDGRFLWLRALGDVVVALTSERVLLDRVSERASGDAGALERESGTKS
jgi:hypothetical protein